MALPCLTCGGDTAGDGWCPRCLTAPAAPAPSTRIGTAVDAVARPPGLRPSGGSSEVSFGRLGRTLWTLGIVAVPVPFLVISEGLAGYGLAALWWGVVTPWAMRDLWRRHRA